MAAAAAFERAVGPDAAADEEEAEVAGPTVPSPSTTPAPADPSPSEEESAPAPPPRPVDSPKQMHDWFPKFIRRRRAPPGDGDPASNSSRNGTDQEKEQEETKEKPSEQALPWILVYLIESISSLAGRAVSAFLEGALHYLMRVIDAVGVATITRNS